MKAAILALVVAGLALAQKDDAAFRKWWPRFHAAVAREMRFPQPWENGPAIREIKSEADLIKRFDVFLTTEIKKQIANERPERLPNGKYMIVWHARGNEYSLHFRPAGDGFALDGLGEGPP